MTSKGIDAVIDFVRASTGPRLRQRLDRTPGTPIEKLMETAMYAVTALVLMADHNGTLTLSDEDPATCQMRPHEVKLWRQYKALDWRADFLIGIKGFDGRRHFLIIECDGHDFHERTKEQAAKDRSRDRRSQQAGFVILRFTGSEIYNDPMRCAAEALGTLAELTGDYEAPVGRLPVSERGVFAVDRGIWSDPDFADETFSEREAFLWLVGSAAWRPSRVRLGSSVVDLARGSARSRRASWRRNGSGRKRASAGTSAASRTPASSTRRPTHMALT